MLPIFHSHLDLAPYYWQKVLQEGDWAIDATCGNGKDSVKLAKLLTQTGGLISLDIQEKALENANQLFLSQLTTEERSRIHLFCSSHETVPEMAESKPIRLIVYNLGYLPGGDKQLTTLTETTLISIKKSLTTISTKGLLSITCYPGHPEGAKEQKELIHFATTLKSDVWNIIHHIWPNRPKSPSLLIIQKKI